MLGRTVSHYRILEELGGGGMGVVYKAIDVRLNRFVALKFLSPTLTKDAEANERFIRTPKAASALDHANICGNTPRALKRVAEPRVPQLMLAARGRCNARDAR